MTPKIIVMMGVSGCGKTTVGQLVAKELGWEFIEGDEYHSPENIAKMSSGQPLNDEDRFDWMNSLNAKISDLLSANESGVLACSALKDKHRKHLARNWEEQVLFIHIQGTFDEIHQRMEARQGHYMKSGMLKSQFEALEPPDNVPVYDSSLTPEEIKNLIILLPEVLA
jgi:carbohydrate kinase (thermoresistant glucokinase family)